MSETHTAGLRCPIATCHWCDGERHREREAQCVTKQGEPVDDLLAWPEWGGPFLYVLIGHAFADAGHGIIAWWEVPLDMAGACLVVALLVLLCRLVNRLVRDGAA